MIPLAASIEGNLVFLIVVAVIGVINWLIEKVKKKPDDESSKPVTTPQRREITDSGGSEQERLKRFLEALGNPQMPPPQRQAPKQAQPQRIPAQKTVKQQQQAARASTKPKPKPQVIPEPEEFQAAGRLEEAAKAIEQVSSEFGVMNVRVEMPPVQKLENMRQLATANTGTTKVAGHESSPLVAILRRSLSTPGNARLAVLTAEILGPPKALRN